MLLTLQVRQGREGDDGAAGLLHFGFVMLCVVYDPPPLFSLPTSSFSSSCLTSVQFRPIIAFLHLPEARQPQLQAAVMLLAALLQAASITPMAQV